MYDAVAAAKARNADVLICDTAGRLHNKKNLMAELEKIYRILAKEYSEAYLETLVVLDGTTGQNALAQAKQFSEVANVNGIILTKLDGTAKGGIDAVLSEFNCTLPGIEPICEELKIKQICLDDVAKKANAELLPYKFEEREAQTEVIIDKIIDAYKERRGNVPMNLLPEHGNSNTLTGVSEGSLKSFLGGSWKPLIDLIVSGDIKGIAGVVGCSNLTAGGHDVLTVELTKELIARDIIVLTAGCSSGGIENCGLMTPEAAKLAGPKLRAVCEKLGIPPVLNFGPCLAIGRLEIVATEIAAELGVDLPQLPLVLSAAQWLEEQAIADGCFGLSLGLPLHLGLPPFMTGSPVAVKVLTEDMKELTGGQVIINSDAKASADILENIIEEKRSALHI